MILAIKVVFIESKHILPKNITNTTKEYFFAYLPVLKKTLKKIILSKYKSSVLIKRKENLSIFLKMKPLLP